MNLDAMIELGMPQNYLINEMKKLSIDEYEIKISKDVRRGITGTKADVFLE